MTHTVHHAHLMFDAEHPPITCVAVDYPDGWQCYLAFGVMEAEHALQVGTLLPVRTARVVFPNRRGLPYFYSDRRGKV